MDIDILVSVVISKWILAIILSLFGIQFLGQSLLLVSIFSLLTAGVVAVLVFLEKNYKVKTQNECAKVMNHE
jgi:hypothetical protein